MLEEREIETLVIDPGEILGDDRLDLLVRLPAGRALKVGQLDDLDAALSDCRG